MNLIQTHFLSVYTIILSLVYLLSKCLSDFCAANTLRNHRKVHGISLLFVVMSQTKHVVIQMLPSHDITYVCFCLAYFSFLSTHLKKTIDLTQQGINATCRKSWLVILILVLTQSWLLQFAPSTTECVSQLTSNLEKAPFLSVCFLSRT